MAGFKSWATNLLLFSRQSATIYKALGGNDSAVLSESADPHLISDSFVTSYPCWSNEHSVLDIRFRQGGN
jgi:hypothetical protein